MEMNQVLANPKKRKLSSSTQLFFKCPECGFEARSPSGLGSHRRKIHGVRGRFSKLPREPPSTPVASGPVKSTPATHPRVSGRAATERRQSAASNSHIVH